AVNDGFQVNVFSLAQVSSSDESEQGQGTKSMCDVEYNLLTFVQPVSQRFEDCPKLLFILAIRNRNRLWRNQLISLMNFTELLKVSQLPRRRALQIVKRSQTVKIIFRLLLFFRLERRLSPSCLWSQKDEQR